MKRFIDQSKAKGKSIKPHQSLVVFLKFMSSIMPTIRYDQTLDVEIWSIQMICETFLCMYIKDEIISMDNKINFLRSII